MVTKKLFYDIADVLDRFRVFPMLMMACYGFFVWEVFVWIKTLEVISLEAAGVFSTVIGVSGFIFNLYTSMVTNSKEIEKSVDN